MALIGSIMMISDAPASAAPTDPQPYVRIAELEIDPQRLDAYKAILATEQEASVRLEPGVIMLHSVAIADHPNQVRLLEVYASRSAYDAHIRTAHFLEYKTASADMVLALKLIDTTPILLCAKAPAGSDVSATCK